MKKKLSLEEKIIGPTSVGLGALCEFGALDALKHPNLYAGLEKAQYGTANFLPTTGIESAVFLTITGALLITAGILAAYKTFKTKSSNYEKL